MGQASLLLHASLVTSIGVLMGFPYWWQIRRGAETSVVQRWRVAHAFLTMDGIFMFALTLSWPALALVEIERRTFTLSLIASGWGFVVAFVVGASTGHRGLSPAPFGLNTFCFAAHAIGIAGSLVVLGLAVYGFARPIF